MPDVNEMIARSNEYRIACTERDKAYAEYNVASRNIELAYIIERNAELASQAFMYVAKGKLKETLGDITDREREIGIAFARYATYGRIDR